MIAHWRQRLLRWYTAWQTWRRWQKALSLVGALLVIAALWLYLWIFADLPAIDQLQAGMMLPSTRILDRNGKLLYEVIDKDGGRHTAVSISQIPQALIQATIATEDRNFYSTPGVDPVGIVRALWINLQGGEVRAGGSTITQQVARNLLLDPEQRSARTLQRKLKEMVLALQLASRTSKDDVLALYLNQSYYGNLAYGVQAAARVYFNKDVQSLDLAECAMLAGLTQLPGSHDPLTNPAAAKDRQKVVLGLMVTAGYLTPAQADAAADEPLQYGSGRFDMRAPHFVLMVWDQLQRDYPDLIYKGGLEVTTTLDLNWQNAAEEIARRQIDKLNNPPPGETLHHASNAALVALDPQTGQVRALLGSVDYFDEQINGAINLAWVPRQPGSTLKPFTYALTFDPTKPDAWTPATMILDVTTPFITQRLQSYTPSNYGLVEHGPVSIREALASSYNIPAVIALDHIGLPALLDLLHKLGISTLNDTSRLDLSVTLGGGEIRLLELTAAYAAFANGGHAVQPSLILEVKDQDGNSIYQWQPPPPTAPIIDPRVAYLITDILSDNNARLPAFGDHSALQIGYPAAAKTGTTTDFRDNWTMGFTPTVVVGTWVGNADNTPMVKVTGISGAGPIWNEFMRTILRGQPERAFEAPDGLVRAEVCGVSGLLPTPYCPTRKIDVFIDGTAPTEPDTMFQAFTLDSATGLLATDDTPFERRVERVYQVLPQEARAWALQHHIEEPPLAAAPVIAKGADSQTALRLLKPDPYTRYQLTPEIPLESQQIRLAAAVPPDTAAITFWLDDQPVGSIAGDPWWVMWALTPGQHTLRVTAEMGDGTIQQSDPIQFTVVSFVPPDDEPTSGDYK
ncbi:MAG: penicillin-binding protein 1C [Anaerolineae bacterium]|nr:penicillin-binding protein 1C [Anaerolineae bacterium]